jgi:glutamyl-tRNA reductase
MHLHLTGINHKTAPLALREKAAINADKLSNFLAVLRTHSSQGIILSTCNRTEIYTTDNGEQDAEKASLDFLREIADVPDTTLLEYTYTLRDREAVEHLFRIASGLESMIIGEFEVLGQVKQSLDVAEKADMTSLPLRNVFQSAIRTGRRVREETKISHNAVSVSTVAVDLAARRVSDITKCRILVIGSGEAGRLVAKVAKDRGIAQIIIASRRRERAALLAASLQCVAADIKKLDDELGIADIVFTCAGAPHRLLDVPRVEQIMSGRSEFPIVIVDIGLPRNVAPEVGEIDNVSLHNIDELVEISSMHRERREAEIVSVEEIIKGEVDRFMSWWQLLEIRPIVVALTRKAEEIRAAQLNKTLKKLPPLSDEQRDDLEAMTRAIVTKILKDPIEYLKKNGQYDHTRIAAELFKLDIERHV